MSNIDFQAILSQKNWMCKMTQWLSLTLPLMWNFPFFLNPSLISRCNIFYLCQDAIKTIRHLIIEKSYDLFEINFCLPPHIGL